MVQKYQSPVRVYKYPFELVMAAYMRRFPTCSLIPVFVGCEILSDYTSPDGAETVTERRCKLNVEAPYILKKMIGVDFVYFIQTNTLDRRKRKLSIEARNESFSARVHVLERCFYFVHPENPEWTCFEQNATLDVKSFFGFESTIEKLAMKQYSQNIARGKEIIDHYILEMKKEGINCMPVWEEGNTKFSVEERQIPLQIEREVVSEYDEEVRLSIHSNASHSVVSRLSISQSQDIEFSVEERCTGHSSCLGLESEYITRFLGNLTPLQESRLVQLRASIVKICQGKVPSDAVLLRFLRATDFNVERAVEMLSSSLLWRKKMNVDAILAGYEQPKAAKEFFPGGWHHSDKEGRPLYLLRLGQMDVKGLIRAIGEDGLLNLTLHICEEGLQLTEEATLASGKPVSTWALLVDLDGLNMRHLWRPGIKALLNIIEVVESNYPETLGRLLFVRAPRVFPIIWTVVGTFIHEATRAKFLIYGGNDYQAVGGLVDYIPEKYVPDFLGGPCPTTVPEGGAVSKCLQEENAEGSRDVKGFHDDGMYTSVLLSDGEIHQVHITSEECGTVLTWDFDVMHHDVVFSVVKHKKIVRESETRNLSKQSVVVSEEEFRQVCREGESIQGSHVTRADGKWEYVLCWKEASLSVAQSNASAGMSELLSAGDLDGRYEGGSTYKSKARLKYYVEKLASADYRGSKGSLLSGQSQFSSLSNLASLPSTSSAAPSISGSFCPSR